MPAPVSVTLMAAKSPFIGAAKRTEGTAVTCSTSMVTLPCPSIASRALTAMLINAVSSWVRSSSTGNGVLGNDNDTWMRAPRTVVMISESARTLSHRSKTSGDRLWRRENASSCAVSLVARSDAAAMAWM